jgi:hypothetical protein
MLKVVNIVSEKIEREFVLPVGNPKATHGQFRHARLADAGTLLVAHMDLGEVCEYDANGKELWSADVPRPSSATPLKNGNILVVSSQGGGKGFVREINRRGNTVWEWTPADAPEYNLSNLQLATRLPNGNTIINNWFNQWSDTLNLSNAPVQAIEVTRGKRWSGFCARGRRQPISAQPPRFNCWMSRLRRKTRISATLNRPGFTVLLVTSRRAAKRYSVPRSDVMSARPH